MSYLLEKNPNEKRLDELTLGQYFVFTGTDDDSVYQSIEVAIPGKTGVFRQSLNLGNNRSYEYDGKTLVTVIREKAPLSLTW